MTENSSPKEQLIWALVGTCLLVAIWELVGRFQLAGLTWPPLSKVVIYALEPRNTELLARALGATIVSALWGYAIGTAVGLAFGVTSHLCPRLRSGISRFAVVANSIPSIALAPIFLILLSRESTPSAVASIHVFFILFIALTSGLTASGQVHNDMMTAFGATRIRRFWMLEAPAALPAITSGLRLAIPVAIIGAIIGEWFGSDRGLGVLIVSAMQNFHIELLWSAALLASLTSLVLYAGMTAIEKRMYREFR